MRSLLQNAVYTHSKPPMSCYGLSFILTPHRLDLSTTTTCDCAIYYMHVLPLCFYPHTFTNAARYGDLTTTTPGAVGHLGTRDTS